jgi:hypothetical protein
MKHFAKDLKILHKAVRLYADEKKREQPGAEALLHSLGSMFADESGTVVSVWVNYNNNPMTFPKDNEDNEEYRGELRDMAEDITDSEGFGGNDKQIYFLKVKLDSKTNYGIAVKFPDKMKDALKEEISLAANEVFSLPRAVFERDEIKKRHNPLGLPELTYYKDVLREYDGAVFLRPRGFSSMAGGMADNNGLDPLMGLYKEYMEVIKSCRELRGMCDFAFDSWALVVLVKRGCSGLMRLNGLMSELSELGIGEAYEIQRNIFDCANGRAMSLGDLLLVSMQMNKDSIAKGNKSYPSQRTLTEMRDERLKKETGNENNGTENNNTGDDKGNSKQPDGQGSEESGPENQNNEANDVSDNKDSGDSSVNLDDMLDDNKETETETSNPDDNTENSADAKKVEPTPKSEGTDPIAIFQLFGDGT